MGNVFVMRTYAFLNFKVAQKMDSSLHAHRTNIYKGRAAKRVEYVARQGRYKNRGDLVATGEVNLPGGADSFMQIAQIGDCKDRSGGIVMKEWDIGFPRELNKDQMVALATDIAARLTDGKPAQWVIHNPLASDGDLNPHMHLDYLPRIPDRYPRPLELICSRHNPRDPASGGWKKERASSRAGYGLKLQSDRLMVEDVINNHMAQAGLSNRVNSRSYAERGIETKPGVHLYQSGLRRMKSLETGDSVAP